MAIVAEFTIDASEFPLGSVFEDLPDIALELERVVPTQQALIPYLWVHGVTAEELETLLDRPSSMGGFEIVDTVDGEYLLRLEWETDLDGVVEAISGTDVVVLSGTGTADRWTFEIRGDDREAVSEFQQHCRVHEIPITLTAVHELSRLRWGDEFGLTAAQREALELAYERGYFKTPREASLEEIAIDLDITGQSLGSRIRRGTHRLIGETLIGP